MTPAPTSSPDEAPPEFLPGCCSAAAIPFGFLLASLLAIYLADALGYLRFNLIYAIGLQLVLLVGFTLVFVARGLDG